MSAVIAARDLRIDRGGYATFIKAGDPIPEGLVGLTSAKDRRKPKTAEPREIG